MFKILYDNSNPFENISPTPFVSRTVSPIFGSKRQGDLNTIVLEGRITGSACQQTNEFSGFWHKSQLLIERFSKPFRKFEISEDLGYGTGILFENGRAIVRSIDFEDSVFAGILPYTITLDVYKEDTFANYGVLNPSKKTSFSENEIGEITVTSITSAKGFDTNTTALDNAVSFVNSITGLTNLASPLFISGVGTGTAILTKINKTTNRLEGSYSVEESWMYSKYGQHKEVSLYDMSVSIEDDDGVVSVTVEGSVRGGINQNFSEIRTDFKALDLFGAADDIYSSFYSGELFVRPQNKQITENYTQKNIDFSVTYVDTIPDDIYLIDQVSVEINKETNKTCVTSQVTINSNNLCSAQRFIEVKNYFNTFSLMDWTIDYLEDLNYSLLWPNNPRTSSITYNEEQGTITQSISFCDKKILVPTHFDDLVYNVSIVPALPTFVPFQGVDCGGAFTIQKLLGSRRKTITIQGQGQISPCSSFNEAKTSLLSYINGIKTLYLSENDTFLTQKEISEPDSTNREITFSFSWSEEDDIIFTEEQLHSSLL